MSSQKLAERFGRVFILANRRESMGVMRIDLCRFFEHGLRLFRLAAPQKDYALQVKNVRMIRRKLGRFRKVFLGLLKIVLSQRLQALIESFLRLWGKNGTRGSSKRFRSRIPLKSDFLLCFDRDGNGYLFLCGSVADGLSGQRVIAEPVENENRAAFGRCHFACKRT